jgi:conjugative relaxase-like TrwC/TraI family protein
MSEKTGEMMTSLPNLGWDFTFSAPKSVSVLWSQGDPELREKIEACHRRAVEKAAEHLESSVYVRSGKGGEVREEGRAILAAFTHTTSRSLDPQLHDHVILINTALRPDGSGGAVDGRELFKEIKTLGAIYRNELRHSLTRTLGVETVDRRVGKERGFEILGVPTPLIQAFSTRRSVIRPLAN